MASAAECRGRESSRAALDSVLRVHREPSAPWPDSSPQVAPRHPRAPGFAGDMEAPRGSWQSLNLDRQHSRQVANDGIPGIAAVGRAVNLSAGCAEIEAARFKRVNGHRVTQHVDVAFLLRQTFRQRFPFVAARATAIHAQLPEWEAL